MGTILQILEKHSINIGMSPVTLLDYPLDISHILKSAEFAKKYSTGYQDVRMEKSIESWKIAHYTDSYIEKIQNDLQVSGKARFYWTEPNSIIPEHKDLNTLCSINFIVSDFPAPIRIQGKEYLYTQAVINVSQPHSVVNGPVERILFKISIFDESYESLVARIPYKKS